MRRLTIVVTAIGLLGLGTAAAASSNGDYRDDFHNASYNGNDGSLTWNGSWHEIGENDGPDTGAVHVMDDAGCSGNKCLHIDSDGLLLTQVGAKRFADASVFSEAELCFELNANMYGPLELGVMTLTVQITKNGGSNWTTVDTFLVSELVDNDTGRTIDLEGFLTEGFGVRFVASGLFDGEAFVDNVEVSGEFGESTTTTTAPATTTTTAPTTTTTRPPTSTTTERPTTTAVAAVISPPSTSPSTSSTTSQDQTDNGSVVVGIGSPPPSDGESGLRWSKMGVQTDYGSRNLSSDELETPEVLGLTVEYAMAVEVIAANWVWPVVLVLLVTVLLIVGFDRRRRLVTPV